MKSRMYVLVILLAGSAVAQLDKGSTKPIEMISSEGGLRGKSNSSANSERGDASGALVVVSDLAIPVRARKEFDKSNQLLGKQDLPHALQKLKAAISMYPPFYGAYNNLGVVYGRLGDFVREREALQKSVELNDHFALGYLNLGRMDLKNWDFPAAEMALDKACTLDSTDPTAPMLLAYSELLQGRLQEAIEASQKAHAKDGPHAFAHRVAARAFQQERQFDSAAAELFLFLKEEPPGPRADSARKELEILQAMLR